MQCFFSLLILLFFGLGVLQAETRVGLSVLRNGGEYNFETGNKFPNLSGIRGGSRISFDRNYNLGGLGIAYSKKRWDLIGGFQTTGWYVPTGKARDQDFFLGDTSRERTTNIATRELAYYDSVNVFDGTRNFADGVGKSSMSEYRFQGMVRYYWGDNAEKRPQSFAPGGFLSFGVTYSYYKFIFYDVVQWVATNPPIYAPIGLGLTYSNAVLTIPYGAGYRFRWEKFYGEAAFHFLLVGIKTRDFHVQRNINFLSETFGNGILAHVEAGYILEDDSSLFIRLTQHRIFSKGSFVARGGFSQQDILSNFAGSYNARINLKEYWWEFGGTKKVKLWD